MFLDKIVEHKKHELIERKKELPFDSFVSDIPAVVSGFYDNLSKPGMSLIAEIKKASPSKGIIREDFNYLEIAEIYKNEKADAMSILTEKEYFKGNIEYIREIKKAFPSVPLLRKDFIIDEYQIYEAAFYGASAILLIGEILSYEELLKFMEAAKKLGLDVLTEVHSHEILKKVLDTPAKIIGVNNRNLVTFEVDIMNTIKLSGYMPAGIIKVAESGLSKRSDIEILEKNGIDAVLIGETFMREKEIGKKIREIMGR